MGTWKSRGLRGSLLEEEINHTIALYEEKNLALIQKIPTPITPIKLDQSHKQITLAYFDKKSTVDYMGIVQGIPICFDAKECHKDSFPLQNLHAHQMDFMKRFMLQGGISFIILSFSKRGEKYYVPYRELEYFYQRMEEGGKKSFRYDELREAFLVEAKRDLLVHFLEALNQDILCLNEMNKS
ncbi:Holliday junction resolvase RecU [Oribacterium sinus]|uniref:Holliday junction resolvase RecU n=1 Tax=Oribacterium sinus TaxID=237576 RepID=UPI0028E1AAEF|nr:Holliday junction resolvase RecU [Oribacterium sinus]